MAQDLGRLTAATAGALALLLGAPAGAAVSTIQCFLNDRCTLTELFAGGSIQVDDKNFKNWGLEYLDYSAGAFPDFNLITVEGVSSALEPNPLVPGPGIRFVGNGELLVSGVQFIDLRLDFRVASTNPAYQIKDASVAVVAAFDGAAITKVLIQVDEYLSTADGSTGLGQMNVSLDPSFFVWSPFFPPFGIVDGRDAVEFSPQLPQPEIYVEKNFFLEGTEPGEEGEIVELEQRYSQLPEPGELLLLGCGAAFLFLLPRRRVRAAEPMHSR